jgi:uncharacterized protein (TIGR02147 family)
MKTEPSVRHILQEELVKRCRTNPAYSLRAFARSLRINHAALSQIINGKRPVSKKMLQRLAEALSLRPQEIESLQAQKTATQSKKYLQLEADVFAVIADWYHFAILELMNVRGFRADALWIGRKLGVSTAEIKTALARLEKLKFIEIDRQGRLRSRVLDGTEQIHGRHSTTAKRLLQHQILRMSMIALNEISPEERSHSSVIMAIDSSKIESARAIITKFRKEMDEFLSDPKQTNRDAVYALHVGLFPVSKK